MRPLRRWFGRPAGEVHGAETPKNHEIGPKSLAGRRGSPAGQRAPEHLRNVRLDVTSILTSKVKEPFDRYQARKLIAKILVSGDVVVWDHCKDELAKDDLDIVDATNVLRCGQITEPAEQERGRWRYRVHTEHMGVVVQFEADESLSIVTAWRKRR